MKLRVVLLFLVALGVTFIVGMIGGRVSGPAKVITVDVPVAVASSPSPRPSPYTSPIFFSTDSREDSVRAGPSTVQWQLSYTASVTCTNWWWSYNYLSAATDEVEGVLYLRGQSSQTGKTYLATLSFYPVPTSSRDIVLGTLGAECRDK
jgi:hypothetical protein